MYFTTAAGISPNAFGARSMATYRMFQQLESCWYLLKKMNSYQSTPVVCT